MSKADRPPQPRRRRGPRRTRRSRDKVGAALAAAGIDAEIELVEGGECAVRCRAIAERGDPLLIVGGGDGTISAAAVALAGTETELGILPLGTLNHFARDLGIPADLDEAAAIDRRRPRAPRRRRRDERPDLHQQQRDRPLSADGRRPRRCSASGSAEASGWRWSSRRCARWCASATSG